MLLYLMIACTVILFTIPQAFAQQKIFAQQNLEEVIYLKNGSVIREIIVEQIPYQTIKIQTQGGSLFVYSFEEIDKITKESMIVQEEMVSISAGKNPHHHMTILGGFIKGISDDLKGSRLDFTNGFLGVLEYRYSFTNTLDGVISSRSWRSNDADGGRTYDLTSLFFGIGVRGSTTWFDPNQKLRPYYQATLYRMEESVMYNKRVSSTGAGYGYGLAVGLDIPVSNLVSIPIELSFISNLSREYTMGDLSGFGISFEVSFNF